MLWWQTRTSCSTTYRTRRWRSSSGKKSDSTASRFAPFFAQHLVHTIILCTSHACAAGITQSGLITQGGVLLSNHTATAVAAAHLHAFLSKPHQQPGPFTDWLLQSTMRGQAGMRRAST